MLSVNLIRNYLLTIFNKYSRIYTHLEEHLKKCLEREREEMSEREEKSDRVVVNVRVAVA